MKRNNGSTGYWLEGVGSRFNLFCMWPVTGASERFLYCKLNGERIADQSSFGDAALENFGLEPEPVLGDVDGDVITKVKGIWRLLTEKEAEDHRFDGLFATIQAYYAQP